MRFQAKGPRKSGHRSSRNETVIPGVNRTGRSLARQNRGALQPACIALSLTHFVVRRTQALSGTRRKASSSRQRRSCSPLRSGSRASTRLRTSRSRSSRASTTTTLPACARAWFLAPLSSSWLVASRASASSSSSSSNLVCCSSLVRRSLPGACFSLAARFPLSVLRASLTNCARVSPLPCYCQISRNHTANCATLVDHIAMRANRCPNTMAL